tara:strand:+ start:24 stop:1121 length:1098 start_codon:yes stop_codon:yes gene_type:complete
MSKAAELAALIGSQTAFSNKNMIINGAMQVAQRGTSSTSTGYATVDRFRTTTAATDELAFTQSQSTTVPSGKGFANSYKIEVTTAESALAADEHFRIQTKIEAQNLQRLAYGTSSAKSLTLSFWVRSSLTGKYSVLFYQDDATRSNTPSFTISTADTWEYKTITINGDTGGTINNDNGAGINITWVLAAGTDYAGTPHTGWGDYAATDDFAHSDQVNFAAQTGTFFLTGVQLEVGETATPFEHKTYVDDLKDCLRYFYRLKKTNAYGEFCTIRTYSSDDGTGIIYFPQPMRVQPTLTIDKTVNSTNFAYSLNSIAVAASDVNVTQVGIAAASSSGSAFVTGGGATIQSNGAGGAIEISFDFASEL